MSPIFRIILTAVSLVNFFWSVRQINKARIKVEHMVFWIVFSLLLAIMAVFPQIVVWASDLLGIISPANFVFLVIIFILIVKLFSMEIGMSKLENKVQILAQNDALEKYMSEKDGEKEDN